MERLCSSTTRVGLRARDVGTALLLSSSGFGNSLLESESVASTSSPAQSSDFFVGHWQSPEAEALHHYYTSALEIRDGPHVKWFCNFVGELQQYPRCRDRLEMTIPSKIGKGLGPSDPRVIVNGRKIRVQTGFGPNFLDLDAEAAEFVMSCMRQVEGGMQSTMRLRAPMLIESVIAGLRAQVEQVIERRSPPNMAAIERKFRTSCSLLENRLKQEYANTARKDPNFFAIEDLPAWREAVSTPLTIFVGNGEAASNSLPSILMNELKRSKERDPVLNAWEVLSTSIQMWRWRSQRSKTKKKGTN